ncbi:MAG: class I SAM-dependent methyltransferase [Bacteroidetes bacterium]|nr:class I SAM-dependent methyltransferase [Bacteroidota bacterium]
MNIKSAYNKWSATYDEVENRTRDLEGRALREILSGKKFDNCLEIGCGTGKNTIWLEGITGHLTSIDLSEEMLLKAKAKIKSEKVEFKQSDINAPWNFTDKKFDLITFSLVLEHIKDLDHIFDQASKLLSDDGIVYVGELHPFKQYSGSKARFETESGIQIVDCFNHHISDFIKSAQKSGLALLQLEEYFDDENKTELPRILTLVFKNQNKIIKKIR